MKKALYVLPLVLIAVISYGGIIWSVADVTFGGAHMDDGHAIIIFIPVVVLACALIEWFLFKDLKKLTIISSLVTFFVVTIIWGVFDLLSNRKHPGYNPLAEIIMMLLLAITCALSVWFIVKITVFAASRLFRKERESENTLDKLPLPMASALFTFFGVIILSVVAIITMEFVYGNGDNWGNILASLFIGILMFALFCALDVLFAVTLIVNIVRTRRSIFDNAANMLSVVTLFGIVILGVYIIAYGNIGDGLIAIIIYIPIFALLCALVVWGVVTVIVLAFSRLKRLMVKGKALKV